ncbi:MAG: NlpC/P60 family protein [Pseudomonadota bacterium]|nr:hypothetical protein [Pseudomonadales bacterium]MDY6919684.1 NlpC/P60 family protein [Pseudomonadota bacterium]
MNRSALLLMVSLFWLGACSSTPPASPQPSSGQGYQALPDTEARDRLSRHFRQWQGVPHRMGGMTKGGIDCSGFVVVTYRDVFGLRLPRSTDQLADLGTEVPLHRVRVGDLLLFKTGFKQRHVGIYLGNGEFIHASSSQGVATSNVHSDYWADAYRQTRRVLSH